MQWYGALNICPAFEVDLVSELVSNKPGSDGDDTSGCLPERIDVLGKIYGINTITDKKKKYFSYITTEEKCIERRNTVVSANDYSRHSRVARR